MESGTDPIEGARAKALPSVSVVVTAFNHAHFLGDALRSVFSQTRTVQQVIVVDDGSQDDPQAVTRLFPKVELIRQRRSGPNAARNAGLNASRGDFVLFLDADDLLQSDAVALGLQCMAEHPGCGLVYGAHRRVDAALKPLGPPQYRPLLAPAYPEFLKGNLIGMHAAVLYDRAKLSEIGGFDAALWKCEEYDAYLRMALRHPIASHSAVVALYRIHASNASADPVAMLDGALTVLERHRPADGDAAALAAYRAGRNNWRLLYANAAWSHSRHGAWAQRWAMIRRAPRASILAAGWRGVRGMLPRRLRDGIKRLAGRMGPPVGTVDLGDLTRARPISRHFGYDRGTPVDRWYIERFLAAHANDIHGRVLEIGDASYSRRFGRDIERQDVLHLSAGNPEATIVGDLSQPGVLPADAFDCLIVTQTLHLLFELSSAAAELRRSLAPGGVALVTVPGVASVDRSEWGEHWQWSMTCQSATRLFEQEFGLGVEAFGNVYAATTFLHGLAVEEIDERLLEENDPAYPMIVCVRARRGSAAHAT